MARVMPQYSDDYIKSILSSSKVIAMVGASGNEMRPSYFAMKYLLDKGFKVIPVNPGMVGKTILGQTVYGTLKDVPGPVDIVDVFRRSEFAGAVVDQALPLRPRLVFLQLGVTDVAAGERARAAGVPFIQDRCLAVEHQRLVA